MTPAELRQCGFDIDDDAHGRLARFVERLLDENTRVNLSGIRDSASVWALHVCDSLALLTALDAEAACDVLDLGTGGGVPGLPLACCRPRMRFTLVDATRKKVAAVERIAAGLALSNVACVWGRAEALAHVPEHRERFDALVARAVAPLPELLEFSSGFVRVGGACWFAKSVAAELDEAPRAAAVAERCALRLDRFVRYRLPANHGERLLLRYEKTAPLAARLPHHG